MQRRHCRTVRVEENWEISQEANNLTTLLSNTFKVVILTDGWKLVLHEEIFDRILRENSKEVGELI